MRDNRLHRGEREGDDAPHARLHRRRVVAVAREALPQLRERHLVADAARHLVDARVAQVHQEVVLVRRVERLPRVRREARHAVHAEEGLQRRGAREHHVQPQVELEPVQQQRPREVALHHRALRSVGRTQLAGQLHVPTHERDAGTLAAVVRLDDERRVVTPRSPAEGAVLGELRRPALAHPPRHGSNRRKLFRVQPRTGIQQLCEADLAAHAHHCIEAVDAGRHGQRQEVRPSDRVVKPHDRALRRGLPRGDVAPGQALERDRERLLVVRRGRSLGVDLRTR